MLPTCHCYTSAAVCFAAGGCAGCCVPRHRDRRQRAAAALLLLLLLLLLLPRRRLHRRRRLFAQGVCNNVEELPGRGLTRTAIRHRRSARATACVQQAKGTQAGGVESVFREECVHVQRRNSQEDRSKCHVLAWHLPRRNCFSTPLARRTKSGIAPTGSRSSVTGVSLASSTTRAPSVERAGRALRSVPLVRKALVPQAAQ